MKRVIRTSWANEELAQVITQLTALHTEFKDNSDLIQHELIEQAIEKLYHAYTLSKPNGDLDCLLIIIIGSFCRLGPRV